MGRNILQKVCADFYDAAVIEAAKEEIMLHNENEDLRNQIKKRKGSSKNNSNMKDILDVIRANEPDVFPTYVAKSLGKMPPLTKNCVNMASLMVEVAQLRTDMTEVQQNKDIELEAVTSAVTEMKQQLGELAATITRMNDPPILGAQNDFRQQSQGAASYDQCHENPGNSSRRRDRLRTPTMDTPRRHETVGCDMVHREHGQENSCSPSDSTQGDHAVDGRNTTGMPQTDRLGADTTTAISSEPRLVTPPPNTRRAESVKSTRDYAAAIKKAPVIDTDGFQTVGRNGRPLRSGAAPRGHKSSNSSAFLRPPRPRKSDIVFLSNVSPDVSEDDLRNEVMKRFNVVVRCKKLTAPMEDSDFASFQIFVQP